jgi:carbonic anhydrase
VSVTEQYPANNRNYRSNDGRGALPLPPSKHVACMDARLDVYGILGVQEGESHVIRNAGGVVTPDALRSLIISQRSRSRHNTNDALRPPIVVSC